MFDICRTNNYSFESLSSTKRFTETNDSTPAKRVHTTTRVEESPGEWHEDTLDLQIVQILHERIALDVSAVYTLQLTTSSRNRKCKMKAGQNADTRNETRRHLTITQHRHDMIRTTVGRRLLYTTEANKHLIANVHCRITNMQLPSAHSTDYMTKAGCMPTLVCSFSRVCPCP